MGCVAQNPGKYHSSAERGLGFRYRATGRIVRRTVIFALQGADDGQAGERRTSAGSDSVPVFWIATTDHDLAEISHVSVLGSDGSLQKLAASTVGVPDAPVGTVVFGPEIEALAEAAVGILGESEVTGFLRESYRPGENFGSAYARLFSRLFADYGVVLLDASDPDLQRIAKPIYLSAIERAAELDDALLARGKELEAAGYHQQVKVTPSSTLVFMLQNGSHSYTSPQRGFGRN